MPWSPPDKLLPVTPQAYALLRMSIDAGHAAVTAYAAAIEGGCLPTYEGGTGCWIDTKPATSELARNLYRYIPTSALPLEAAQAFAKKYFPDDEARYPAKDAARLGWPTFVDRDALVAALDGVTSPEVKAKLGPLNRPPDAAGEVVALPSADAADPGEAMSWWVVALSAGGVLSWLGRSKVLLAVVGPGIWVKLALAAATILLSIGLAGGVSASLPAVKKAVDDIIVKPLAKGANILAIVAGIGGAVVVTALVVQVVRKPSKRKELR